MLALKPLDEVGGDQALPPVQDLPVEEAILINNSIHHRWWRKEKRIEGKDGMENILFLFNDTPPPRKILSRTKKIEEEKGRNVLLWIFVAYLIRIAPNKDVVSCIDGQLCLRGVVG